MATRHRSPNYPAAGLGEAVNLLLRFYSEAKRTSVDELTAAQAIGYQTLNGASRTKLSVLKKYGLLDEADGRLRVSDLGIRLVVPSGETDRADALREAALRPDIFREVHSTHAEASSSVLVNYLMREKGFSEDGARAFDAAYRDTVKVAKLDTATYIPDGIETIPQETSRMQLASNQQQNQAARAPLPSLQPSSPSDGGSLSLNVPYRGSLLRIQIDVPGQLLTRDHIAKVRRYLELAEEDLGDGRWDTTKEGDE